MACAADTVFTLPHTDEKPPPDRRRLGAVPVERDGAPRIDRGAGDSVAETHQALAGSIRVENPAPRRNLPSDRQPRPTVAVPEMGQLRPSIEFI
jgi:hypothetical protein